MTDFQACSETCFVDALSCTESGKAWASSWGSIFFSQAAACHNPMSRHHIFYTLFLGGLCLLWMSYLVLIGGWLSNSFANSVLHIALYTIVHMASQLRPGLARRSGWMLSRTSMYVTGKKWNTEPQIIAAQLLHCNLLIFSYHLKCPTDVDSRDIPAWNGTELEMGASVHQRMDNFWSSRIRQHVL